MKQLLIVAMVALCGVAFAADVAEKKEEPKKKMTLAERKARAKRNILMRTGGYVVRPGTQTGKISYINGQKRVPEADLKKHTDKLAEILCIKIEMVPGESAFSFKEIASQKKKLGANGAIFFIDDATMDDTMLVAPENGWAVVNFAALAKDKPTDEKLSVRAVREVWRSFAYLLGAANSNEPKCVMRPISSPGELDDLFAQSFCPEPLDKISSHLRAIGVESAVRKTYRQACIEGWAPAPENEFQKAIFEQVKADKERGPTNPIKIEYKK